ncbi:MAG: hypothetical protein ACXWP5_11145 [Bdellovibrionota bacterium]
MIRELLLLLSFFGVTGAQAAPIKSIMPQQRLLVQTDRTKGNAPILKEPMKVSLASSLLQWDVLPGSSVSIPYVDVKITGIPIPNDLTVLAERMGTLKPDKKLGYFLHLPMLRTENEVAITIVDKAGHFEEWHIKVILSLQESAVYVDENCADYMFKIREKSRSKKPNLIFIACKPGSGPRDMSLDIFWGSAEHVEYRGQNIPTLNTVVTVPLESKQANTSELTGVDEDGGRSVFDVDYEPYVQKPWEIWAGLAFLMSNFRQDNFAAKFQQMSPAFIAQFWFKPEDSRLSFSARAVGNPISFSQTLTPSLGYQEDVQTYFLNTDLRIKAFDIKGWRMDPFLGAWFYFQNVRSQAFGIQRIIDPQLGLVLEKSFAKRDRVFMTLRYAPLQSFLNPLAFSINTSYFEGEIAYEHTFRNGHKLFFNASASWLNYVADAFSAQTTGNYLVVGGGYGY